MRNCELSVTFFWSSSSSWLRFFPHSWWVISCFHGRRVAVVSLTGIDVVMWCLPSESGVWIKERPESLQVLLLILFMVQSCRLVHTHAGRGGKLNHITEIVYYTFTLCVSHVQNWKSTRLHKWSQSVSCNSIPSWKSCILILPLW